MLVADYWTLIEGVNRLPEFYAELEKRLGGAAADCLLARLGSLPDEQLEEARESWRSRACPEEDRILAGLELFVAQTLQGTPSEEGLLQELAVRVRDALFLQRPVSDFLPLPWDQSPWPAESKADKARKQHLAICADIDFLLAQGWKPGKALERCAEHYPLDFESIKKIHYAWRKAEAKRQQLEQEERDRQHQASLARLADIEKMFSCQG